MADKTNVVAAQPQASDVATTPLAPETHAQTTPDAGTGISQDFLAELGLVELVETPQTVDDEVKLDDVTTPEAVEEAEISADATEEEAEEGVTETEKNAKWPDAAYKRLSKVSAQKNALKQEVADLKEAKEAAESALAQSAESVPQLLPSSPLAHLDTLEALESEAAKVVGFMKSVKDPTTASKYKDYDDITETSELFEKDQAYCLSFLENQTAHAKALAAKETTRAEVRKNNPALFDGKSAEFAERLKLHLSDPRSNPDYDQFIADAIAGRNARLKKATPAIAPKAKTEATAKNSTPPTFTLPAAKPSPVVPLNQVNPKDAAWAKAKRQEAISIEDMDMAGAFS